MDFRKTIHSVIAKFYLHIVTPVALDLVET